MPVDKISEFGAAGAVTKDQGSRGLDEEKLRKACKDFEAIFINQLLQTMRRTVPRGGFLKEGSERTIFQSLFDQELSRTLAQRKGMGLGEMIYRQMTRPTGGQTLPAESLAPGTAENTSSVPTEEK